MSGENHPSCLNPFRSEPLAVPHPDHLDHIFLLDQRLRNIRMDRICHWRLSTIVFIKERPFMN